MKRLREYTRLAGRRTLALMAAGAGVGLALSAVEIAFAGTLQAFLVVINALSPSSTLMPAFVADAPTAAVFAVFVALGTLRAVLVGAAAYLQGAAAEEFRFRVRSEILRRSLLSRAASSADVMTLFTIRTDLGGALVSSLQGLATQATTATLLISSLCLFSGPLTAGIFLVLGAASLPLRATDRVAKESGEGLGREWRSMTERLLSSVRNLLLLRILGTQGREESRAQDSLFNYRRHALAYFRISGLTVAFPQALGLLVVCALAYSARRWDWLAPGALLSYLYLFLRLVQQASTMNQSLSTVAFNRPHIEALLDWSSTPYEPDAARFQDAEPITSAGFRLRGARFRYPEQHQDALAPTDLDLTPGQTLIVTGPSGAGKSTLVSILLGLLEPSAGTAESLLDGEAVPAASARGRLLPAVGYVGSESFLIEGTVRDNLVYGLMREPSPSEIEEALSAAECGFLKTLPGGISHRLTEQGQGLSAGQKQRLSLARALLRGPAVLVLDEATSNLDAGTEARVVETLARLKGRMTLVVVSHRPALLALGDRHLVLDATPAPNAAVRVV